MESHQVDVSRVAVIVSHVSHVIVKQSIRDKNKMTSFRSVTKQALQQRHRSLPLQVSDNLESEEENFVPFVWSGANVRQVVLRLYFCHCLLKCEEFRFAVPASAHNRFQSRNGSCRVALSCVGNKPRFINQFQWPKQHVAIIMIGVFPDDTFTTVVATHGPVRLPP